MQDLTSSTRYATSKDLFERAQLYIPGGVNSPVRAFQAVNRHPIFAKQAQGALLTDADNNTYIDYIQSWGPLILGHASPIALEGVHQVIEGGTTFGLSTQLEIDLAQVVVEAYPGLDQVRFVSSGTEATMSALRLARAFTGKTKTIKFEGCYHGHSDALLVKAGSGLMTQGVASSQGIPSSWLQDTLVATYNDLNSVEDLLKFHHGHVASIIVEPIAANMGLIAPQADFLAGLRSLCDHYGALLIFDEVITGFRVHYSGAAGLYGVTPDLACFGKIVGGGMPLGAYGARREIMEQVAPLGKVYQAGTLSGNPVAVKMGLNVLNHLKDNPSVYSDLQAKAAVLEAGMLKNILELGFEGVKIVRVQNLLCQFFTPHRQVHSHLQTQSCRTDFYSKYFNRMLDQGILVAPAQFECMFLSTAHTQAQLDHTLKVHMTSMSQFKTT